MFKKTINKLHLSFNLSKELGYSINLSKKIIDDLIDIIIQNIKDDNFNLKNIGKFKIIQKKERIGRNPKTKEKFLISSRKSLSFTPSKNLKIDLDEIKWIN